MSTRFETSEIDCAYKYTLVCRDSWHDEEIRLTQAELSGVIDALVRVGKISELDAVLGCFKAAWLKLWEALPADAAPKQRGPLKGAMTHVVNKTMEAILRNGVLAVLSPREVIALMDDVRVLIADVEEKRYSDVVDSLAKLLYASAKAPRMRIETLERYAHVLARPGDFPDVKVPAPATDTVSAFVLTYLDPQRVVLAEQCTAKRLPVELDKLQPMYSKQLEYLYEIVRAFNKPSIRRFAYCTAVIHRANPWASRMAEGQRDPPEVGEPRRGARLPTRAELEAMGLLEHMDPEVRALVQPATIATAKVMGHTAQALEEAFAASIRAGKRKRAADEPAVEPAAVEPAATAVAAA